MIHFSSSIHEKENNLTINCANLETWKAKVVWEANSYGCFLNIF